MISSQDAQAVRPVSPLSEHVFLVSFIVPHVIFFTNLNA